MNVNRNVETALVSLTQQIEWLLAYGGLEPAFRAQLQAVQIAAMFALGVEHEPA